MDSLISLFFGRQAHHLMCAYYFFEGEQIFQEEDPVRHEALFKNIEKRTPRAITFGFKGTLDALEYQNYSQIQHTQAQNSAESARQVWNSHIKVVEDREGMQAAQNMPFQDLIKVTDFEKRFMVQLEQKFEGKFERFSEGAIQYLSKHDDRDIFEDSLRLLLEETDFVNGFQIFAESDGFASIAGELLLTIQDECPKKATISFPLWQPATGTQYALNKLYTLTKLRERSTLLVPFCPNRSAHFSAYDNALVQQYQDLGTACAAAPILANITLPYRLARSGGATGLHEFAASLNSYNDINVFECVAQVPLLAQNEGEDEEEAKHEQGGSSHNQTLFAHSRESEHRSLGGADGTNSGHQKSIFEFKEAQSTTPVWSQFGIRFKAQSYAEAYVVRGRVGLPNQPPQAVKFNVQMLDEVFTNPRDMPNIFAERVVKHYAGAQSATVRYFPLHSCIVANEGMSTVFKSVVEDVLKAPDRIQTYRKFEADNLVADDFAEMISDLQTVTDAYIRE